MGWNSSHGRFSTPDRDGTKDSVANIRETGVFCVNVVSEALTDAIYHDKDWEPFTAAALTTGFIGFGAAKIFRHPEEGTAWLNIFIIYAALPALFFKLVSRTPFEQLTRLDFVSIDVAATYSVFLLLFAIGYFWKKNGVRETTIQAFAGSYGNIGYMGPGLALLALGETMAWAASSLLLLPSPRTSMCSSARLPTSYIL